MEKNENKNLTHDDIRALGEDLLEKIQQIKNFSDIANRKRALMNQNNLQNFSSIKEANNQTNEDVSNFNFSSQAQRFILKGEELKFEAFANYNPVCVVIKNTQTDSFEIKYFKNIKNANREIKTNFSDTSIFNIKKFKAKDCLNTDLYEKLISNSKIFIWFVNRTIKDDFGFEAELKSVVSLVHS